MVHTGILRCTLATDDSRAYWRKVDLRVPLEQRSREAFDERWFGLKSEARVDTLIRNMAQRFDAFPEALALLHGLENLPAAVRPWICHLHTQLSDPLYRRFTGEYLPQRLAHGVRNLDRDTVARWVESLEPGRWSVITCRKFGSNLLTTATEAGLLKGRPDARELSLGNVPEVALGYALYLLRTVRSPVFWVTTPTYAPWALTASPYPERCTACPASSIGAWVGSRSSTGSTPRSPPGASKLWVGKRERLPAPHRPRTLD